MNARDVFGFIAPEPPSNWSGLGSQKIHFLTFRLADAVPVSVWSCWREERRAWLRLRQSPWTIEQEGDYEALFTSPLERYLDTGKGSCLLREPECMEILIQAFRGWEEKEIEGLSWVIMPNHVHGLFRGAVPIEPFIQEWKSWTARKINTALGRRGEVWQKGIFVCVISDDAHLARCIRYIRRNPQKAGLSSGNFRVWESEAARRVT